MASAAVRSKSVVLLLSDAPIVCEGLVLGPAFVLQYFVSFLVLRSSRWGRKSWLLNIYCVLNAMSALSFFLFLVLS